MMYIINKSIDSGKVPDIYKIARVVPLYKKGAHDLCLNYRPVSLSPSLSKILNSAVLRASIYRFNWFAVLIGDLVLVLSL